MDEVTRFRRGWRQLPWYAVLFAVQPVLIGDESVTMRLVFLGLFASTVACAAIGARYAFGTELRPDALVVLGLRRRVVMWSRIEDIRVGSVFGTRVVRVVADGRHMTLPAPSHLAVVAPDPQFAAKVDLLGRYWVEHRGTAWAPRSWEPTWAVQRTS